VKRLDKKESKKGGATYGWGDTKKKTKGKRENNRTSVEPKNRGPLRKRVRGKVTKGGHEVK